MSKLLIAKRARLRRRHTCRLCPAQHCLSHVSAHRPAQPGLLYPPHPPVGAAPSPLGSANPTRPTHCFCLPRGRVLSPDLLPSVDRQCPL